MRNQNLKPVTVYLSPEEYQKVKEEADDNGVMVSALVRAKLGFKVTQRGAPKGNKNRAAKDNEPPAKKPMKKKRQR
jgi:hypothetical protein